MIRIRIELLPFGYVDKSGVLQQAVRHLGTGVITNDGTGTIELGNYDVTLSKWGDPAKVWKRGIVTKFNRKKFGPWDLLCLALCSALGEDRLLAMLKDTLNRIKKEEKRGKKSAGKLLERPKR